MTYNEIMTKFALPMLISGGQTGVDRAALDFALRAGINCAGWCPLGRKAEDGPISAIYPLKETQSEKYQQRTRLNVKDSDATLILTDGGPSRGTALTANLCLHYRKPFFVFDFAKTANERQKHASRRFFEPAMLEQAAKWLCRIQPHILNIAGPRASECPQAAVVTPDILGLLLKKSEALKPEWPPARPHTPDLPADQ